MPATDSKINVRPMSVHIGAEIEGVELAQPLSAETVSKIRQALLKWKVVFFRDQHLDHSRHVQFARHFGALTPGHVVFGHDETYPEIYSVSKFRTATQNAAPPTTRPWSGWHTDVTAALNPPAAHLFFAVISCHLMAAIPSGLTSLQPTKICHRLSGRCLISYAGFTDSKRKLLRTGKVLRNLRRV